MLQIETWVSHTVHSCEWTEGVNHARRFHSRQPSRHSGSLVTTHDLMCSLCGAETEFDSGDNTSRRFYREVMKTIPRAVWGACTAPGVNTPVRVATVISVQFSDRMLVSFCRLKRLRREAAFMKQTGLRLRELHVKDNISWKKMRCLRAPAARRIFLFDLCGVNESEEMTRATH